jgi:hypothetical protein
MHEIHPNQLWIGHALDLREPRAIFDSCIAAVIDLAFEELPAQLPRQLIYCRFPIIDGGGNKEAILFHALQTIIDLIGTGTRTIVGCSAGMSRSPTLASFALAAHLGEEPSVIVKRIASIKALDLKPELWNDMARVFSRVLKRNQV